MVMGDVVQAVPQLASAESATAALKPESLGAYKKLLMVQFFSTLAMIAILGTTLLYSYNFQKSPLLLPLIMEAGIVGALFSALTRLYNVDQTGGESITPTINSLNGLYITMYALVPPLIGAIAAIVLYLVFVSKLVQSPVFPTLDCQVNDGCKDILGLMQHYWPTKPEDYGKALVWSIIAGFSERFVPDVLQSLVAKQQKAGDKSDG
jgi:hypothetical protein